MCLSKRVCVCGGGVTYCFPAAFLHTIINSNEDEVKYETSFAPNPVARYLCMNALCHACVRVYYVVAKIKTRMFQIATSVMLSFPLRNEGTRCEAITAQMLSSY